ncbi:amidophosphoribosyltransferase [Deinococcus irradiatisoli]|uniref:Amidophosphoribosyltransferase n=1 Tax=Deinococcus irradiatisoli TaxID=2202254 RepID=A0A2Z3JEG5_9DEIO|nr:ComF family protein [Deinococcus irradiatisoli]AWN23432.1 amidophosphoribosyltransferase [Deinococcus irradiatisoli]
MSVLRALLPRPCPGCGEGLGREAGLCQSCRAQLSPRAERHSLLSAEVTPHLVVLGRHHGALRRAARELKYTGHRDLAQVLGAALARGVPGEWQLRAVSAVPMHPARQRQRHFNHAEVLARCLAAELGLPYLDSLRRTRQVAQQARLSGEERRRNLEGVFEARGGEALPQPLLLVDDVLTTSATLMACRDALQASGVTQLYYAVLTR